MIDLYDIKDPNFIKDLSKKELKELCAEIRKFLLENISQTGGHLSSNLGVVEITVAMYYVFDIDKDEFLFDVGHQSYVHKILTGRAKDFKTIRTINGISGFIDRNESKYDIWESGHSSTSISAASGLMLSSDKRQIVLIGDSSISNGVAFEGLNYLGQIKKNNRTILILNDNKMGISKTVGSLTKAFSNLRSTKFVRKSKQVLQKIFPNFIVNLGHQIKKSIKSLIQRDNIFEDLGFDYFGPYDGHNIVTLIKLFKRVKTAKEPAVLHLITKKGKGYEFSEQDSELYHSVAPFDLNTGIKPSDDNKISYSTVVSNYLTNKRKDNDFFVITPAMKSGSNLDEFSKLYPQSFIDVGIAEEHAAILCAGLAIHNKKSVLLMYSTFFQRAYDQMLNDICRQNLDIIIGLDRSNLVQGDGSTHQGIYDISMLIPMPNVIISMPKDIKETVGLFNLAFNTKGPFVIRYPKASELNEELDYNYICPLTWEILNEPINAKIIIISYGNDLIKLLNKFADAIIVNARIIKPIDKELLKYLFDKNLPMVIYEKVVDNACLYNLILDYKEVNDFKSKIYKFNIAENTIIPHASIKDIENKIHLSMEDLDIFINKILNK